MKMPRKQVSEGFSWLVLLESAARPLAGPGCYILLLGVGKTLTVERIAR
jgi:hypothetical protein